MKNEREKKKELVERKLRGKHSKLGKINLGSTFKGSTVRGGVKINEEINQKP